ncbi:hypothetical protein N8835_03090, partial [Alphaproteobacteria bacterium]|nr:hypothetical protein [Alphaproteobacteria bacterium]
MVNITFRTFGYVFGLVALYAIWTDISTSNSPSTVLGQFWFEHHASSLQITESVVSRYIDPCGLIIALNCEPFLWHPLVSTMLGWPAALVLIIVMALMMGIARLARGRGARRASGSALK